MKYDVVIIGSGPAGLSAAIYTCRSNLKTLVIENESFGGKLTKISKIENYPGFSEVSGSDLAESLLNHTSKFNVEIIQGQVKKISDNKVILEDNEIETKAIIVCSGVKEKAFDIPKAKEYVGKGISYCAVCDGFFFRKKDVAVIGNDHKAIEDTLYLAGVSNKVYLINDRGDFNAENSLVNELLNNQKIEVIYNSIPLELIIANEMITGLKTSTTSIKCVGIFPHVGISPNTHFLDNNLLDEKGFLKVDEKMNSLCPYIFGAGDVIAKDLRQIVTACGEGAQAASSAISFIKNTIIQTN